MDERPDDDSCLCCPHPYSAHDADARAYCLTTLKLSEDHVDVSERGCAC